MSDAWQWAIKLLEEGGYPDDRRIAGLLRDPDVGSMPQLVSNYVADVLDGKVDRRGRPKNLGKKAVLKRQGDIALIERVHDLRKGFEANSDPAPVQRAFEVVASERNLKSFDGAKRAYERALEREEAFFGPRSRT
jgi:hypothetical protein